ncbi:MAG: sugar kinase [Candidatus Marinimicrobia bacterium]|nr:sugar kinase [Candidatus Neomarinimicrobiota bacterium]|tara:strand:- start:15630 stop:16526 length:897 start_codon:yes stop_codon:yes gene_type:complete
MKETNKIAAVGSVAFDTIETPNGSKQSLLGGSATYFGIASSYYTQTSLIGVVGTDFTNNEWDVFKKHNINTDSIEIVKGKTFSWGGRYSDNYSTRDTLFTELGVFENFKPNITQNIKNPILYLGNIQPELQFDVIKQIERPHLIAADSMNLWIDLFPKDVWKLITKVDILFLNDEEAIQLTGNNNINEIAEKFLTMGPNIIIIKLGSKGALLATKNSKTHISVVPDTTVIDPTGAGDSFAGGTLGYIARHGLKEMINAVKHGTTIASYTVSNFGINNLSNIEQKDFNQKLSLIKVTDS